MRRLFFSTVPTSLFVLAAVSGAAHAQVKTDGLWRGTAGAALAVSSGNTSSQTLAANVDMVTATAADKITLGGGINYGSSKVAGKNTTTANKWAAAGQYDYNLSPKVFVFGKLGLEGDELSDLSMRSTLAGGVGYKLVDSKEMSFSVFGGAGYSTDKYDINKTIGGKTAKSFSRASLMLGEESSHQLSPTTSFKQRLELYPGLSGDKAMIAKFTAGLGVAMSSTMNLTVGLSNNYNSKAAAGTKKNDAGLFMGVNVKLGAS
jgi:putative salt-induced outer membrane protein